MLQVNEYWKSQVAEDEDILGAVVEDIHTGGKVEVVEDR